ncbi:hypothetical protein BI364_02575 [Acidihalobacter yilgarnensis]|uniref:Exlusion protein FxsA n=2 Tax=Acidihalobacter yilgarnensis TaxID=2819280 RepID=A0A1D8ISV4_9GAMM|nr:hypothetical protein BI364_02575 [Acidihalobacter yilgarnensis]
MRIFPLFALILIGLPLLELYLLIKVGTLIGALPTVALVVGTALLGAFLLRRQGLSNYRRMQQSMARGEVPAQEMMEGVVILVGSVLLLVPGLITDVIGLLCLLPPLRRAIIAFWLRRVRVEMKVSAGGGGPDRGRVYDAEYRHLPPDDDR